MEKLNLKPEALTWIGFKCMAVDILPNQSSITLACGVLHGMESLNFDVLIFLNFFLYGFSFKFLKYSPFLDHKDCLINLLLLAL